MGRSSYCGRHQHFHHPDGGVCYEIHRQAPGRHGTVRHWRLHYVDDAVSARTDVVGLSGMVGGDFAALCPYWTVVDQRDVHSRVGSALGDRHLCR